METSGAVADAWRLDHREACSWIKRPKAVEGQWLSVLGVESR